MTSHLVPKDSVQSVMFDNIDRSKHSKLMQSIDSLNSCFGESTVQVASHAGYKLDSNKSHMSPRYTTDWDEILKVKFQ